MFSKITFLKSGDQAEKNEVCLSFLEEIFTKSVHRGGVTCVAGMYRIFFFRLQKTIANVFFVCVLKRLRYVQVLMICVMYV